MWTAIFRFIRTLTLGIPNRALYQKGTGSPEEANSEERAVHAVRLFIKGEEKRMKPHVIIIMADQLRQDVLGCGFTPNIDSIAAEGTAFCRTYCASPLCVPARGAFFTGTYPNQNGSLINPWEPADARYGDVHSGLGNLYTMMEENWDSIHSGKQHLFTEGGKLEDRPDSKTRWFSTEKSYKDYLKEHGVPMPGGPQFRTRVPEMVGGAATRVSSYSNAGTGRYDPGEMYYFDSYFTEKALEGIKSRDTSKPLLLNAMFLAPHPPLQIPEPWYGRVKSDDFQLPENVGIYYPRQSPLQMYNLTGIVGSRYGREHWKEAWRVYLGLVAMLDHCVGRILEELKRQEIYDDSLIIFTSDHGEMLGSHGLFQKMCMYEESARVPLFMRFPNGFHPASDSYDQVVSHIDVLPTLCEYLGLEAGYEMAGTSLMPLLRGEKKEDHGNTVFIQYDGNGSRSNFQRCVVQGRYKLIIDLFKDEVYYELYDIKEDAQEKNNLMFDCEHDEIAENLAKQLDDHMRETNDMVTLKPFDAKAFRKRYEAFPAL